MLEQQNFAGWQPFIHRQLSKKKHQNLLYIFWVINNQILNTWGWGLTTAAGIPAYNYM